MWLAPSLLPKLPARKLDVDGPPCHPQEPREFRDSDVPQLSPDPQIQPSTSHCVWCTEDLEQRVNSPRSGKEGLLPVGDFPNLDLIDQDLIEQLNPRSHFHHCLCPKEVMFSLPPAKTHIQYGLPIATLPWNHNAEATDGQPDANVTILQILTFVPTPNQQP